MRLGRYALVCLDIGYPYQDAMTLSVYTTQKAVICDHCPLRVQYCTYESLTIQLSSHLQDTTGVRNFL